MVAAAMVTGGAWVIVLYVLGASPDVDTSYFGRRRLTVLAISLIFIFHGGWWLWTDFLEPALGPNG